MNTNEHWLTLGAGLLLIVAGGRGSVLGRALSIVAGGALVVRAIEGDGLRMLLGGDAASDGRRLTKVGDQVVASTVAPDPAMEVDIDQLVSSPS